MSDRADPDEGWIGVDLDSTLAFYDGWQGPEHIGEPIPKMVERVKGWLKEGKKVKLMTARCFYEDGELNYECYLPVQAWMQKYLGTILPVTQRKDLNMIELWDDRAVQVIKNSGEIVGEACPRCGSCECALGSDVCEQCLNA